MDNLTDRPFTKYFTRNGSEQWRQIRNIVVFLTPNAVPNRTNRWRKVQFAKESDINFTIPVSATTDACENAVVGRSKALQRHC
jgi:hypothetical protein